MITRLVISNFRSIGADIEIRPGRMNFLVGINGSGKSNVLRALTFVRESVRIGLQGAVTNDNGIDSIRRHSSGHPRNVKIEIDASVKDGSINYGFEIAGDRSEEYRVKKEWGKVIISGESTTFSMESGNWNGPENLRPSIDSQSLAITSLGGDERIKPLWDFLANMMVYSIYPDVLREPQKFSSETPMQSRGDNWVSILHQQEKAGWKQQLVAALEKLTSDIDDIKVAKASGFLITQFHHKLRGEKTKKWFGADLESDGTLRVAGLLTALLQDPAPTVIGIEEPELTVHPGALPLIYDYLHEASERAQIFVTTHSPILLDYINLDNSSVFVVQRDAAVTSVRPLSEQNKDAVRNNLLTLGELMISGEMQLPLSLD